MIFFFFFFLSALLLCFIQIIQDRVDSLISRNRLLWNSLPGGLYALPQYSTDAAQFPFYYALLGEYISFPQESFQCSTDGIGCCFMT